MEMVTGILKCGAWQARNFSVQLRFAGKKVDLGEECVILTTPVVCVKVMIVLAILASSSLAPVPSSLADTWWSALAWRMNFSMRS